MLTRREKRMIGNLRTMAMVIAVVLLVVLVGQQEKEAMTMDVAAPSAYEIGQMENMGYTYEVTEDGLGYFVK